MKTPISFYSEGVKLDGDVYVPDDVRPREKRAGIVLCHGYTGVKEPAFGEVMQATLAWYREHLPARPA